MFGSVPPWLWVVLAAGGGILGGEFVKLLASRIFGSSERRLIRWRTRRQTLNAIADEFVDDGNGSLRSAVNRMGEQLGHLDDRLAHDEARLDGIEGKIDLIVAALDQVEEPAA